MALDTFAPLSLPATRSVSKPSARAHRSTNGYPAGPLAAAGLRRRYESEVVRVLRLYRPQLLSKSLFQALTQLASNDYPQNLVRSLIYLCYFRVPHHALHRVLAHVPVSTE